MNTLDTAYKTEQNKIAATGAWIWLLEISTTGYTTLRYANNNENVVWPATGGNTYCPLSFIMEDINVSTRGEFPEYRILMGDVDVESALRVQIRATDGMVGSTIRFLVVHSSHLDLTTPAIDETAEILSCETSAEAVTFVVGIPSLLSRRFPRDRYVPGFCRHKFGGALCQYKLPTYTFPYPLISNTVAFVVGPTINDAVAYNEIRVGAGGLITRLFVNAPGQTKASDRYLNQDTGFVVSGSKYNDGLFLVNSVQPITQYVVRVYTEAQGGRPFVAEAAGAAYITLKLGYDGCDHTYEACALRGNIQNYGGSPGIAGGIYG